MPADEHNIWELLTSLKSIWELVEYCETKDCNAVMHQFSKIYRSCIFIANKLLFFYSKQVAFRKTFQYGAWGAVVSLRAPSNSSDWHRQSQLWASQTSVSPYLSTQEHLSDIIWAHTSNEKDKIELLLTKTLFSPTQCYSLHWLSTEKRNGHPKI